MAEPTLTHIEIGQRFRMAGQLDEIVRELQVLQHLMRSDSPAVLLATVSTGLIGAKITLTEIIDTLGAAEGEAVVRELTGAEKRFYGIEA